MYNQDSHHYRVSTNSTAKTPSLTTVTQFKAINTEVVSWVDICESAYCETPMSLFVHCVISIIVRQVPVRHFPFLQIPVTHGVYQSDGV